MPADNVRHILLVTLSNIGDAVMTTPVMEALHDSYPQAVMDIVTDPRSSLLFEHCPYRERLILRDKRRGWHGTLALIKRLRRRHYDLIVDLRTDGLAWLLRAHRRLTRRGSKPAQGHAVERHMRVITRHEAMTDIPPTRLWLSATEHRFAQQMLARLPGKRWLSMGPGANWGPKRWPVHGFIDLVTIMKAEFDAAVLLGGPDDESLCQKVADSLSMPCLNLAGRTDLLQAAAILEHMRVFVGNDSGLGHLAAASGCPTVTVFGPGNPQRYHPWNPRGLWLRSRTRRLSDLSATEVADAVTTLLDSK
ncbi:MAG: glycosyltransferase family 9 protein [Pseudomonadota bacterium]|nr:glycosyltransferase family 9 protein [Pseudomonadota bacterium]